MLRAGKFKSQMTVAASIRNRMNMEIGRRYTIMNPTTEIKTTTRPSVFL